MQLKNNTVIWYCNHNKIKLESSPGKVLVWHNESDSGRNLEAQSVPINGQRERKKKQQS